MERTGPNSARAVAVYDASADELRAAVLAALRALKRWRVDEEAGAGIAATRSTRIFGFEDGVRIQVSGSGEGSEAVFESHSKTGHYDFGQNRRNLKELLDAVNRRLAG